MRKYCYTPFGLAEWLAWEKVHPSQWQPLPYRCDKCGRGYIRVGVGPDPRCIDYRCEPPGIVRPAAEVEALTPGHSRRPGRSDKR